MKWLFILLLTSNLFALSENYKILIYSPQMGHSHVNFLGRIADTLVTAGHDVLFYLPEYDPQVTTNGSKLARLLHRKRDFEFPSHPMTLVKSAWKQKSESFAEVFSMIDLITQIQVTMCEKQLQDKSLLERLQSENFDLGISEVISFCGIALFEKIGLKNHIGAFAVSLIEGISEHYGVINNPSFVPAMFSPTSDVMSYLSRIQNFATYLASWYIIHFIAKPAGLKPVHKYVSPDLDPVEVGARSSFVFVNADEFLEFPRPISHKVVYVGGIAVPKPQPLENDYAKIMDSAKAGAILISFGSIAKSSLMTNETKAAFTEAFKKFSNIKFIWKYEEDDDIAANLPNVFKKKWVPQNDLLNHPNMRAFVSHGGMNSLTEGVHAGVPIICIPLFGDQMRNAKMIEKRGVGLVLNKHQLDNETILEAFNKILDDKSYIKASRRLAAMIAQKPISVEERIVKYTEFAAEFGPVENLDCTSRKLYFFQYYLLDIIVPFAFVFLLFMFLFFKAMIIFMKFLLRSRKNKLD